MPATEPTVNEPAFWEERYQHGEAGWDIGRPAPPLASWLASAEAPPAGRRVAVLGSGRGHEAVLFVRAGHQVTGFDFAPSAVRDARANAAAAGLDARFEQADIFDLLARYRGAFDLAVEHTCFCAIDPSRRGEYVQVVRDLLASQGQLVGLFFAHGQPGGPPFTTSRQEVERLFRPRFDIVRLETAHNSVPSRAKQELFALMRKRD